ncbi:sensor histidine kinase [Chitinophaga japonensis]|nr:HAMP domain-containing sensor histidine kinase [Chitinophaga japonensis]
MHSVRKRIWWIAAPAVLAALLFQLYWLRQTYRSQQEAFVATATEAFQKAYDLAIIRTTRVMAGESAAGKGSYNFQAYINLDSDSSAMQALPGPGADTGTIRLDTAHLPKGDRNIENDHPYAHFVSTLFASFTNITPDRDSLDKYYRAQLREKHIHLPFTLFIGSKAVAGANPAPVLVINPTLNNPAKVAGVHFSGLPGYLLQKMGSAILLSGFIALLITGCIWILWRIILRQEKLERMKRDFISHVTHELKTPVAILKATNEALLTFRGMHDAGKTERYLRHSGGELERLQELIDKVMQVSRLEQQHLPLQVAPAGIRALVEEAAGRFSQLPDVQITLRFELQQEQLLTDAHTFHTILANLLDNAARYNDKPRKEIQVTVRELPAHISFAVTDNGNGIEKQHFPFLYDKFYRVTTGDRQDTRGYGLGLSHVKALLQQLQGSISVHSTPGKGTTFTFQLPK